MDDIDTSDVPENVRDYVQLELESIETIEHEESAGAPGETIDVYTARGDSGEFWVVDGAGLLNLYSRDEAESVEELIQMHVDLMDELAKRS